MDVYLRGAANVLAISLCLVTSYFIECACQLVTQ